MKGGHPGHVLLTIFLLLYLNFRRITGNADRHALGALRAGRRHLADVAAGYNLSVAVAVGFIALAGVARETGVVMLIYLDHAWEALPAAAADGRDRPMADLYAAIMEGAVERVPLKMMTVVANCGRPLADHVGQPAPAWK